jgi:Na+:H+ antiporter, NhaA family
MSSKNKFVNILLEFSLPLLAGVFVAVVWANISPEGYHHIMHQSLLGGFYPLGESHAINFHFLMNDIFMVLFFGIATKEITESCLPGGDLNPIKNAINPLLGTIGGVLGPVAVYFAYVHFTGAAEIARGWGIPTATDIALAWLVAKIVFGAKHPAVSFLLLLAVADDGLGLVIIAIFYGDPNMPAAPQYLGVVAAAMFMAWMMRKKAVHNFWAYLAGPGILAWGGLIMAHLHPALALVFVIPFMPTDHKDDGLFLEEAGDHKHNPKDTLNNFEHTLKVPVEFGLFGFGLANAGVAFSSVGHATWAVLGALLFGKTIGIFGMSYLGTLAGFPLPKGMNNRDLCAAGVIAGLGLTVALFVAGVAFSDPTLQGAAKMGAMLSAGIAPIAIILGKVMGIKRKT